MTLVVDGQPASLSSRRQEQLLALLICAQGRVVAAETLIDAMWGERLGPRAGKNLQVLVHRLRKTLDDPERIRHDRSGYALSAQTAEVDAWHFADLAERARRALDLKDLQRAAVLQREALALWRGRAFAGLDDVTPLAEAAERLEQDRRRVLTERIDVDLVLGRHAEIIPELISMVAENPLVESAAARLMVAMHRSGQRTEALETYRRTRAVLAEELGLEPGPQLRALEAAILRGDAHIGLDLHAGAEPPAGPTATAPSDPVPFLLPAGVGDLTGREDELRRLTSILRDRPAATPAICAVSGMPGVGKTALAVQAAHEMRDDFPDGQLYVNLRGAGAEPIEPSHALSRFLRALGVPGSAIPDGLDERAEVFRARLSGRRVLVLLDDAADEAQVEPLIPPGNGCAVMITSRGALTALPGAHRLVLGVLTGTAAVGLLSAITGRAELTADGAAVEHLAELCGRLPLALRIAGARLAARPHWTVDRLVSRLAAEHDRLDELTHGALSVRASLALGYSGLTEPSRTLFRRLGLVETPDFAGWVAAALLDTEPREAEDVLEGLMEAQLIEYAGLDGIGEPRYRIHDLVRLHARERGGADEPPGAVDAALTRLTGGYLALAEQAHRRQYGGDYTVLHGDGPRWDCGTSTVRRLLSDPAGWLRSERLGLVAAVEQAARLDLSDTCWDLAMTAITLFEAQGHFDNWRHTSETALAAVRRVGNTRGEAAMLYSLGTLDLFRQHYIAAQPHFDAALPLFEAVNDQHGQALTLRNAALIERVEGRAGRALRRYRRALRMLREVGDRHAEAHVLGSIAQIHLEHGRADATPLLETALAVYHDLGDLRGAAQILNRMGALHLRQGRTEQAKAAYRQVSAASQAIGDRIGEAYGLLGMGETELLAGELDHAAEHLDAALTLADGLGEAFVAARARLAGGRLAAKRGEREQAVSMLDRAIREFAQIGLPLWHERALDARRALDDMLSPPLPY
ncbi:AfsR/SARP family transcriptional regulator [Streptosporangium lutulentum]|uniref:DNA-binding SARP family transcriptional activator n=1 Tax=Streptosporangium lutulentum TaxID=1461250 RepID=A0ABT9QSS1_9ACTN|nr:AfsR/SARP family transcriptional regulator [Streptosporangium lutulentum]MDP9849810.1 DNA-binding SARP family transcriptional activator [Streptosporangium lutulentum]